MDHAEALKIYQHVLDASAEGMLAGDAKVVASFYTQPSHLRTNAGWFPLNNFEDIEQMVASGHSSLMIQGATDVYRIAQSVSVQDDGSIQGTHITHILRHSNALVKPYESRIILVKDGEAWKISRSEHSLENDKWPITVPQVKGGRLEDLDQNSEIDKMALDIYQAYIDLLTVANFKEDTGLWNDLCMFPHSVKFMQTSHIVETPNDLIGFHQMIKSIFASKPGTILQRKADFAGFLDSHTVRGYHTAHFKAGGTDVIDPVRSRMTLRLKDAEWRMIEVVNSIKNTEFPYSNPIISDHLTSEFHNPNKANP